MPASGFSNLNSVTGGDHFHDHMPLRQTGAGEDIKQRGCAVGNSGETKAGTTSGDPEVSSPWSPRRKTVPARSSSPIPAGLGQLATVPPAESGEHLGLLDYLAAVPDPRRAKGRRHPLAFVLALAAWAVLAGAMSLSAITEWAADAPPAVLAELGGRVREPTGPTAPADATIRRVLQRVDGDALDTPIGA